MVCLNLVFAPLRLRFWGVINMVDTETGRRSRFLWRLHPPLPSICPDWPSELRKMARRALHHDSRLIQLTGIREAMVTMAIFGLTALGAEHFIRSQTIRAGVVLAVLACLLVQPTFHKASGLLARLSFFRNAIPFDVTNAAECYRYTIVGLLVLAFLTVLLCLIVIGLIVRWLAPDPVIVVLGILLLLAAWD